MAINWGGLEKDIEAWFADLSEKTEDDTAKFLADSYGQATMAAADPNGNAVIPPGKESGIESAWSSAFAAQKAVDQKLGPPGWMSVEGAIMLFWTACPFSPAPPHPGTVTPISNITTMPGAPGIAAAIDKAFNQEDAAKTAKELVTGYKNHASSIMGMYIGLIPPTASTPLSVVWTGIK
jgi:hypothetical protein